MQAWWKAAVVTVISMAGIGYAAGSVLGGSEQLPDVGAPVVLEQSGGLAAQNAEDDEDLGGVVHPDPQGDPEEVLERREARREARLERREERQDRRAARLERREERDQRGSQPPASAGDDGDDDDSYRDDRADDDRAHDDGDDDRADDDGDDDDE